MEFVCPSPYLCNSLVEADLEGTGGRQETNGACEGAEGADERAARKVHVSFVKGRFFLLRVRMTRAPFPPLSLEGTPH